MANRCPCFFDFFLRKTDRHAHLQGREDDLLRLAVIVEGFEAGYENAVGETLRIVNTGQRSWKGNSPRRQYPVVRIADPR